MIQIPQRVVYVCVCVLREWSGWGITAERIYFKRERERELFIQYRSMNEN